MAACGVLFRAYGSSAHRGLDLEPQLDLFKQSYDSEPLDYAEYVPHSQLHDCKSW